MRILSARHCASRCLEGRFAQRVSLPIRREGRRRIRLSASDRKFPPLTGRSGTQRARRLLSRTTAGSSAPWSSSPPSDLRITRVFPCVACGFKVRASFMFAGCCWWRSLADDGYSGTSRGHAPVCVGQVLGGVAPSHDRTFFQAGHIPSRHKMYERPALSPIVADRRRLPLVTAVAVTVAVRPAQLVRWQAWR